MKWHEEVVTDDTIAAAQDVSRALGSNYYLAGGTALALRLGHRISLDLDIFTDLELGQNERNFLIAKLAAERSFKVTDQQDGTIHGQLHKTAISIFRFPYPIIGHLDHRWQGLAVASYEDIAAMKLNAVLGRGSRKDFVDLYFLSERIGLKKVFHAGSSKFKRSPNFLMQAAKALVYFEDADQEPMPRMIAKTAWADVKAYFESRVPKLIKGYL